MKKLAMAGIISLLSSSITCVAKFEYGYKIEVNNTYDGDVKITIDTKGPTRTFTLPAKKITTVSTRGRTISYCFENLKFEALTGLATGNTTEVKPPVSKGIDYRCGHLVGKNSLKIIGAQDKTLVVEGPISESGYEYKINNTTGRQVVAHFRRSKGTCSLNPQFLIEPRVTRSIKMGECCFTSIFFRFASGPDPRKTFEWKSGNPCDSHSLTIQEGNDNSLVVVK